MNGRTRPVPIDWKTTVEMSSLPSRGRSCQNDESRGVVEGEPVTHQVFRPASTVVAPFLDPPAISAKRLRSGTLPDGGFA